MSKKREIKFFKPTGSYGFLCNFYPSKITIGKVNYESVEHYYQSRKAKSKNVRVWIASAPNGHYAFNAGRAIVSGEHVKNWNKIRVKVMRRALLAKFTQNTNLRLKLLKTGNAVLHEDNPYGSYWAIDGKDVLGRLLMELREKLRQKE